MMTVLEMMRALEECGDLSVRETTTDDGVMLYDVTMEDFEGFDAHWREIERDYTDEELVDTFLDALEELALRATGDMYRTYYFDGYAVQVGYASYDI